MRYHDLGAAAVQGDAGCQVCAVVADGASGAVELELSQVDVWERADREHQIHLCFPTGQLCREYNKIIQSITHHFCLKKTEQNYLFNLFLEGAPLFPLKRLISG